jgi:hypothetical protein
LPLPFGILSIYTYIIVKPFFKAVCVKVEINALYLLGKRQFAKEYKGYKNEDLFH